MKGWHFPQDKPPLRSWTINTRALWLLKLRVLSSCTSLWGSYISVCGGTSTKPTSMMPKVHLYLFSAKQAADASERVHYDPNIEMGPRRMGYILPHHLRQPRYRNCHAHRLHCFHFRMCARFHSFCSVCCFDYCQCFHQGCGTWPRKQDLSQ